mgnify:CR=1 FL=1
MRQTNVLLCAVLAAGTAACAPPPSPSPSPPVAAGVGRTAARPNIVFLFSDDHAAHALSAYREHLPYGARLPDTPNLDRLAASGMLFTNAFVTNSICAPSRATILTGQYGHLNGVMTNAESLHVQASTVPMLLRDAGYETALFGKWHLKAEPRGFDRYEIMTGQGTYYNPILHTATDTTRHTGYTNDVISSRIIASRDISSDTTSSSQHRFTAPLALAMASVVAVVALVGQTVRLTADLSVVEGCIYAVMELTVAEGAMVRIELLVPIAERGGGVVRRVGIIVGVGAERDAAQVGAARREVIVARADDLHPHLSRRRPEHARSHRAAPRPAVARSRPP